MSFVSDIWLDSVAVHEGVECCAEGHCQWFVARGELAFVADGIEGVATAGDVVWRLPRGVVSVAGGSDDLSVAVVEFGSDALRVAFGGRLPEELVERAKADPVVRGAHWRRMLSMLSEVAGEDSERIYHAERLAAALGLLESELAEGLRDSRPEPGMIEQRHFGRFSRLVSSHVLREHAGGWYAERLCLSPQYLSQVVRGVTGRGALAYINEQLADRVAEMLSETDMTVQQVADAAGFADQAVLTKFFRRMRGVTPSEWRRR